MIFAVAYVGGLSSRRSDRRSFGASNSVPASNCATPRVLCAVLYSLVSPSKLVLACSAASALLISSRAFVTGSPFAERAPSLEDLRFEDPNTPRTSFRMFLYIVAVSTTVNSTRAPRTSCTRTSNVSTKRGFCPSPFCVTRCTRGLA